MFRWLIFMIASACVVICHVIPEEARSSNAPDPFAAGCNVTKSCFLVPDSCLATGSCRAGVAVVATSGRFQFEMMAVDSVYVAAGLSADAFMGKDSVVECVHDELAPEKGVQIFVSFNDDTTNTRMKTSAAENGVNLVTGTYVNGVVRCTFTRDNATRAEGIVFDLAKKQYHLLVASGSKIKENNIAFHDREAAGSRNGRLLGVVGMFVNPNSATSENDAAKEAETENDAIKEAEADNLEHVNSESASEEESVEYDDLEVPSLSEDTSENIDVTSYDDYDHDDDDCGHDDDYFDDHERDTDQDGWTESDDEEYDSSGDSDAGDGKDFKGFTARGCNETKSCFLMPPSCLHTDACTLAASVRRTDAGFEFEMMASDSVYVAVALSTDAIMGSDSVVECVSDGVHLVGHTSWNKGHKNYRIHEPLSKSGVALLEGSTADGRVYCKFARDPLTTAEGVVFDLNKTKFHLLMASGTKLKEDGVGFHDRGYAGSYDARLLADVGMFAQRRRRHMIDGRDDDGQGSYELADAFRPIVTIV